MKTDIIVVGAGPAGSMAAMSSEAETIVIDQRSEIGVPKQCAEGVSESLFQKMGVKPKKEWISAKVRDTSLISPSGIEVSLNDERVKKAKFGYVLNRKSFDKGLAEEAVNAGAELMPKTRFITAERTQDGVRVHARQFGKQITIEGKILIACDGVQSKAAKSFDLNTTLPLRYIESCYQYEMTNIDIRSAVELYFGRVYAPGGYVWIFPKGENSANVGIGIVPSLTEKKAREYLDEFLRKKRLQGGKIVEINAGAVPISTPLEKTYADNLLICGDAARMVNPLTGGGIQTACISGMLAGRVASKAIEKEEYSETVLGEYHQQWKDAFGEELEFYGKAQKVFIKLTDKELDTIAQSLADIQLESVSTMTVLKAIIKMNPKLLWKLKSLMV
ncbi:MAG: NAD(P)/FAD-dependent oxidoreductase [Euryarchaeota archaeon]|nr:NAD(P)/FAD-dependent oxidoreductase [Euryarchaeota archaeon]